MTAVPGVVKSDQLIQRVDSQFRRTYSPTYSWADVVAAYTAIPGLRGFWPMSTINASGAPYDLSEQGHALTNIGQCEFGHGSLVPYTYADGTNDYLFRADQASLDITGTETYVLSANRGLTIGGWFFFPDATPANNNGVIGKYNDNAVNQRSYLIYLSPAGILNFIISVDGTATTTVASSITAADNTWYFIAATFDPSTYIRIFVDDTIDSNVAAIPASIFNSNAQLNIFAFSNGLASVRLNGYAAFCFLSCMNLTDGIIRSLYEISRPMFGK